MEWTPNEKMTTTDLRAVLMSWGVPTLSSEKKDLIAEVAMHYKRIMIEWTTRVPDSLAVLAAARSAAASSGGDDKSVGTDRPQTAVSYIGSDEAPPDENLSHLNWIVHSDEEVPHINEQEQSAACAAAPPAAPEPPSLRRAIEMEEEATAKVNEANATVEEATLKVKKALPKGKGKSKSKSKMYGGYLPMAGVFIDEDQKKDGDDDGDLVVF